MWSSLGLKPRIGYTKTSSRTLTDSRLLCNNKA